MLTQAQLKEIINYNPDSGAFTWIKAPNHLKNIIGKFAGSVKNKSRRKRYIRIKVCGYDCAAHRLAFLWMNGCIPIFDIDHIDGNGLNNKWNNLRISYKSENYRNKRLHSNNASGVCGVVFHKNAKKWQSQISVDKKHIYLGLFDSIFDAACARKSAENKYGFHENHGQPRTQQ